MKKRLQKTAWSFKHPLPIFSAVKICDFTTNKSNKVQPTGTYTRAVLQISVAWDTAWAWWNSTRINSTITHLEWAQAWHKSNIRTQLVYAVQRDTLSKACTRVTKENCREQWGTNGTCEGNGKHVLPLERQTVLSVAVYLHPCKHRTQEFKVDSSQTACMNYLRFIN